MSNSLWPDTAQVEGNSISLAGCDLGRLAVQYGTPLYVFDEKTIQQSFRAFRDGLDAYPGDSTIFYACKALLNTAIAQLLDREGAFFDVVSLNELLLLRHAGIDLRRMRLHGNGTPLNELYRAVNMGIGQIVLDNQAQIDAVATVADYVGRKQPVLIRLAPDITAGSHTHIQTGQKASKFGFNNARMAIKRVQAKPALQLQGLHAHLGSQIDDLTMLPQLIAFLHDTAASLDMPLQELCIGGGLAVATHPSGSTTDIAAYCKTVVTQMRQIFGSQLPHLSIEPGRSIVGRAGVALYKMVGCKTVDAHTSWLHLDGGMGDNIRPALYGARYHAAVVDRPRATPIHTYHLCGRYCESGDVLVKNMRLPAMQPGDVVAIPSAGAYTLSMASNYNGIGRPAVVLVRAGQHYLIQERETIADIIKRDRPLPENIRS